MKPAYNIEQLAQPPPKVDVLSPMDGIGPLEREDNQNRLRKAMHAAKRAVEGTVIALELGPTNEAIRYGAFGVAVAKTESPLISAAVLGGTTLLVEGSAALAAADILTTERSTRALNWVNDKIERYVPKDAKMTPVAEIFVAIHGGSAVVLAEKQREDLTRTVAQNRKHGMFTAGWMTGVFTVEGALIANGIEDYHNPAAISGAALAVGGLFVVTKWAKNHIKRGPPNEQEPGA